MTTTTPPEPMTNAGQPRLPEEKFWQRYSPHQEMPVSAVSSLTLHGLAIGSMLLLAWLGWLGFKKPAAALPVEPVSLLKGVGGEGGLDKGSRPSKIIEEDPAVDNRDPKQPQPEPDPSRPTLDPPRADVPPSKEEARDIPPPLPSGKADPFDNIKRELDKRKFRDPGKPEQGKDGSSKDGGQGSQTGPGTGNRKPPASLDKRQQRMQRWSMIFDTRTGQDYRHQLHALGAILAIPTSPDGQTYKIVRDLGGSSPVKLLDEDISTIQRIYWIDNRPESVQSLMLALKCDLQPKLFIAFMPEELEDKLFKLEKSYKGLSEDQIDKTEFRVVPDRRGGFTVVVVRQTAR